MFKIISLVLLSSFYLASEAKSYSYTVDWFNKAGLEKEVNQIPKSKLYLYYNQVLVNLGNTFTPTETRFQPFVYLEGCKNSHYTLVMFDPDAGKYSQVVHWLVTNIRENDMKTGDVVADYLSPAPPKDQKPHWHRYTFLVFQQKHKIDSSKLKQASTRSLNGRLHFDVNKFARQNDLGKAIYGNYFYAKYDSFVDKFYEMLEDD